MSGQEIRKKIDSNNLEMQVLFNPSQFVLNTNVAKLIMENHKLQCECEHEFVDGVCKWCDLEEGLLSSKS